MTKQDRVDAVNAYMRENRVTLKALESRWRVTDAIFELKYKKYEFFSLNRETNMMLENGLYCFGGEDHLIGDDEVIEICNGTWDIEDDLVPEAYKIPVTLVQCTDGALGQIEDIINDREMQSFVYLIETEDEMLRAYNAHNRHYQMDASDDIVQVAKENVPLYIEVKESRTFHEGKRTYKVGWIPYKEIDAKRKAVATKFTDMKHYAV